VNDRGIRQGMRDINAFRHRASGALIASDANSAFDFSVKPLRRARSPAGSR
jgi:hypothetical protein